MSARGTVVNLRPIRARARLEGFSLVELMIALTLSLLVLAAIGWVYMGTMRTYRSHDALSRMQESARYAFEVIGKDLRMIGAAGCSYVTTANALNNNTDWYKNLFGEPLVGAEKNGVPGPTQFSDTLSVLRADIAHEYIVQAHDSAGAQFTLTAAHDLSDGQLMVATDCSNAAVFQATSAAGTTVSHAAAGVPGNSTANLGSGGAVYTYGAGSRLYRLHAASYYVANNNAGVPSLFRLAPEGATAALTPEELVEGVEDMQVAYGVDTSATPDGQVDFVDPDGDGDPYLTADQIDAAGTVPGATAQERWARVVSVRISLLMRTVEDRVASSPQHYDYNGALNITAPDLRLRKVFTHVIKVRNR